MSNPISYTHGTSQAPLVGETIGANFDRIVAAYPQRDALVSRHQNVRWTYAELAVRVERVARALVAIGLRPGDRLGIWAPNCAEWVLVQYASAKAGLILVNVNPAYRTSELEYVLKQSGCRVLISAREFKSSDYVAMVKEVAPQCQALERTVFLDSSDWEELLAAGDVVAAGNGGLAPPAGLEFDDPINIQYTSGTTVSRKERHSLITTFSTTASSSARRAATRPRTGSASQCRSTTALGWCSAISPARRTVRAWSYQRRHSSRAQRLRPFRMSAAHRSTGCRRCSSPNLTCLSSRNSI